MSNLTIGKNLDVTKSPSLIIKGDRSDRLYWKCGREIIDLNLILCS